MASPRLFLAALRPLGPSRAIPRQLSRFSSVSSCLRAEAPSTASATSASRPSPSQPAPVSAASTPKSSTTPAAATSPAKPENPLPYHVLRTPSNQLPIYQSTKRGGNLKQTKIRKIYGNALALRNDLQKHLNINMDNVRLNPVTGHIDIKGWYKREVEVFLSERGM